MRAGSGICSPRVHTPTSIKKSWFGLICCVFLQLLVCWFEFVVGTLHAHARARFIPNGYDHPSTRMECKDTSLIRLRLPRFARPLPQDSEAIVSAPEPSPQSPSQARINSENFIAAQALQPSQYNCRPRPYPEARPAWLSLDEEQPEAKPSRCQTPPSLRDSDAVVTTLCDIQPPAASPRRSPAYSVGPKRPWSKHRGPRAVASSSSRS
jgi:hypothetical protein